MLFKCSLVFMYLVVLFILSRLLELVGVFDASLRCSASSNDVSALNATQIKTILTNRGISYRGLLNKDDFVALINDTGLLTDGELLLSMLPVSAEQVWTNHEQFENPSLFLSGYKSVDVWLIQPLYDTGDDTVNWYRNKQWLQFLTHVHRLGIHTGFINCSQSHALYCKQYHWSHGQPVLVLPDTRQYVFFQSFHGSGKSSATEVFEWMSERLSQRLHHISSGFELRNKWLKLRPTDTERINVIFFLNSKQSQPPLFFSVLSVQFEHRVKFGVIHRSDLSLETRRKLPKHLLILLITPETTYYFGDNVGDCLTYNAVELLLISVAPSGANVIQLFLSIVLMAAFLQPVTVTGSFCWRLFTLFTLIGRLMIIGFVFSVVTTHILPESDHELLYDVLLYPLLRLVSLTTFGGLVRTDLLRFKTLNFGMFVATYLLFVAVTGICYKLWSAARLKSIVDVWQQMTPDTDSCWPQHIPQYWIQPSIDLQYIDSLHTLTYTAYSTESADKNLLNASDKCLLCRCTYTAECLLCVLPCQHVVHYQCMKHSAETNNYNCPQCYWPSYLKQTTIDCQQHVNATATATQSHKQSIVDDDTDSSDTDSA